MIRRSKRFKNTIAMILTCSTVITCSPSIITANADTSNLKDSSKFTTEADQGVILHAWNWSFNSVKNNLDNIKGAGYTEVQVSPIQINKDLKGECKSSDTWWIIYQPAGFTIGNKQLGTEDEFKELCRVAKEKGVKIIVDTIVNHMGNNGDANIPADEVDKQLSFKDHPEYWHIDKDGKLNVISDYNNRFEVTHHGVGLPDLNTANKDIQRMVKQFLQRCLDDGAAGFRFDTAKHVELPEEPDDTADKKISSDFWPSVLEGLKTQEGNKPFIYAEVLQGGSDRIEGYAKYFDVTASNYGGKVRNAVGVGENSENNLSKNFEDIKDYEIPDGIDASQIITWVESHDTYANPSEESTNMTGDQIRNAWAIVASREGSTPLYFNRTAGRKKLQGNLGDAGDDSWRDPNVTAVNKFHNAMQGQDERLTLLNENIIMIERGIPTDATKKGVVIVNLGEPYELKNQSINLDDNKAGESYRNCAVTGEEFTVIDGKISGNLPKGITVLYEGGKTEAKVTTPKISISKENSSFYDTLELTLNVDQNGKTTNYSVNGVDKGSFTNEQKITIGSEAEAGKSITVVVKATSAEGKTVSETYTYLKKDKNSKAIGYFVKPSDWKTPYAYVSNELGENLGGWPGIRMTKIQDNLYKYEIDGFTDGQITFNDSFYGNHKTGDLKISANGMMCYNENKEWKSTEKLAEDPNVEKDKDEKGTSTVYFQKPDNEEWKNVDDVNIYFYGKSGPSWPGVAMQKVEGSTNLYTYTLPAGLEESNVIFNGNGGKIQTPGSGEAGFTAPANSTMIFDGSWREYAKGDKKVSIAPKLSESIYATTTNIKGTAGANADIKLTIDEEIETTTSAGAKVEVISKMEEKEIAATKADENGNWSVKIPAQKKDTVIKIRAKEEGKDESEITVKVINKSSTDSTSGRSSSSRSRRERTVSVEGNTTTIKSTDESTIRKEIANSETSNIEIDLSSEKIVDKGIFEALANKSNKTLTLTGDNASWTFNGANILIDKLADIDITIKSTSSNSQQIKNLTVGNEIVNLSFVHKGQLPGKAKIEAKVDSKYNNKTMNIYSYNLENNRLQLLSSNVPVKDGIATFEITKGSDYVLSETPIAGAVKEGWNQNSNGKWIFVKDENNAKGWINDGANWYLCNQSGIMQTGWAKDKNSWYYLNSSGQMKTGWVQDGSNWYYLKQSGSMNTGWVNDNGTWYYLNSDGSMASNTIIDGYELGANGTWIK